MVVIVTGFLIIVITMMIVVIGLPKTLFTVEDQEIHAERVEGRNKNACHHRKVGKTGTWDIRERNSFDDRILGIEPGEGKAYRSEPANQPAT